MAAVLVIGNLSDGHRIVGPYDDICEALAFADLEANNEEYWAMTLTAPEVTL